MSETSQPFLGIISGERRRDHAAVAERVDRIASGLAKLGVKPLDFDGHSDALLHPFDGEGRAYMQYVNDHGSYHDVPAKFLMREMAREYANMQGEDMSGRDMEREAAEQ